MKKLFL